MVTTKSYLNFTSGTYTYTFVQKVGLLAHRSKTENKTERHFRQQKNAVI